MTRSLRRWLLVALALPVVGLPIVGWRAASAPPYMEMTPALAYSPTPTPPVMFPPALSTVPVNTEIRVGYDLGSAQVTARDDAKHPIRLDERAEREGLQVLRPSKMPKRGAHLTMSLGSRLDGGPAPYGAGVLGALTFADAIDTTPPVLVLEREVTRKDALSNGGRLAGFPDELALTMRVDDASPVAAMVQIGRDVPRADARQSLHLLSALDDGRKSLRLVFAGPSAGVRVAVQAVDAAGNKSAWAMTDTIPKAADEDAMYPADAGGPRVSAAAASATAPGAPGARPGCGR